jgi:hypothetical protein
LPIDDFQLTIENRKSKIEKGDVKMRINKLLKSKRTGSAIALALLAVIILVLMGTGLLSLGLHGRMIATRTASEISARCAADAGLAKAVYEMNEKLKVSPWDDNTLPQATNATLTNSDALFNYTITSTPDYIYHVNVTGRAGRETKNISCTFVLVGLFRNAVHAQNNIVLENGYLVDAYSSEQGPYGGVNALQPTSVSTADANTLAMGSGTVYGDFLVDYGRQLPAITAPTESPFDVSMGSVDTNEVDIYFGPEDSGKYEEIKLSKAKLVIDGDVTLYVTGDFDGRQYSSVEILPDSSLTLYIDGNMNFRNTSSVNGLVQDPKMCQIFGTSEEGQSFLFEQSAVLYGTIYAPDADITMNNSAELYGAIISDNAEIANTAELHFDATLLRVSVDDLGAEFAVRNWQED